MFGAGKRLLERARPGVLFKDLQACNDYEQAPAAAAKVKVPVTVVLGERDLMTPPKAGCSSLPGCPIRGRSSSPVAGICC